MPVIAGGTAPRFNFEGTTIIGLAAPSRGSCEISSWRVRLEPGTSVPAHILSREEVFVVLHGKATVILDGERSQLGSGDALAVPPGVPFALTVDGDVAFEAVVAMPVGGQARLVEGDGTTFPPPWSL
jgi:quercetin dioxygenase-like cupin family protein